MSDFRIPQEDPKYLKIAFDVALRLTILGALIYACYQIMAPFIEAMFWGIILAVALFPVYKLLTGKLGIGTTVSAILIGLVILITLVIPAYFVVDTIIVDIQLLAEQFNNESFTIPPPTDNVKDWPLVGKPIYQTWMAASQNLEGVVTKYGAQLKDIGSWLLETIIGLGVGVIQFILATVIACVLLINASSSQKLVHNLFIKIAGKQGEGFASMSAKTIMSVIKGVIGVALIQSTLAAIGFMVAGIPGAALWALLCLVFCIIQIGIFPVAIPVVIYAFSTMDTVPASMLAGWMVFVSVADNILKPILLGKGAPVPMLVIFIGVIGGFMASGFSGMFTGAILFSIGYKVFIAWIETPGTKAETE